MHATPLNLARLLIACWILGDERDLELPTADNVLDRALAQVADDVDWPRWARAGLHFADARVGLLCVELPDVLEWAQSAELTDAPSGARIRIKVGVGFARRTARRLGLDLEHATRTGRALRRAAREASARLAVSA